MPTPIDLLADPLILAVLALYFLLALWETLRPARVLPVVPGWRLLGLCSFAAFLLASAYLPFLWADLLEPLRLADLSHLPVWQATIAGVVLYEAAVWGWHRSLHASPLLWRYFHQWHHSAERLDTAGAFWFSPLDIVGWVALGSLFLAGLVGFSPEATFATTLVTTFFSVFQHTNVRTPRWLGYLVQRPESHSWHHARGLHAGNYSDLPLFDALLGTLNNPPDFAPEQGLGPGASREFGRLLRGRDVEAGGAGAATS
jgi:sterol desaturase/sphingolipid hydroxylase (fatty acid hydroxylase superfamily)